MSYPLLFLAGGVNGGGLPAPDKLNGELRNHLDSIFSGFQKLINGTTQVRLYVDCKCNTLADCYVVVVAALLFRS